MISKDSQITKDFAVKVFLATHNSKYTMCCLASIENEENMRKIMDFIDNNPNASITEIEIQMLKVTGRIRDI